MTRAFSAAALVGLLVLTVLAHPMATVAVAAIVAGVGAVEAAGLSRHMGVPISPGFVGPIAAVLCCVFALGTAAAYGGMLPVLLLALVVAMGVLTLAASPPA